MTQLAYLFPGQGSQEVGMGKALAADFPVARRTFDEADDALGMKLSKLCFEGPEADLRRTAVTQPAILTVSVAAMRVAEQELGLRRSLVAVCGHSLGEYSALVAAGCLALAEAVKAVQSRGQFMQEAVPEGQGAMAAILGLDAATITEVCGKVSDIQKKALVEVANYNGPEQTVIAGHKAGVEKACAELKARGAKKVVPLPVSAPFHCYLMTPVQNRLLEVLSRTGFGNLQVPCVTNVLAEPNTDPERARQLLVEQVVRPVRFTECAATLVSMGVDAYVELGPGRVLSGIVKRAAKGAKLANVEDPKSLAAAKVALGV
jgi:[acyl-carrier-protein] S-malonyltransferase